VRHCFFGGLVLLVTGGLTRVPKVREERGWVGFECVCDVYNPEGLYVDIVVGLAPSAKTREAKLRGGRRETD